MDGSLGVLRGAERHCGSGALAFRVEDETLEPADSRGDLRVLGVAELLDLLERRAGFLQLPAADGEEDDRRRAEPGRERAGGRVAVHELLAGLPVTERPGRVADEAQDLLLLLAQPEARGELGAFPRCGPHLLEAAHLRELDARVV